MKQILRTPSLGRSRSRSRFGREPAIEIPVTLLRLYTFVFLNLILEYTSIKYFFRQFICVIYEN